MGDANKSVDFQWHTLHVLVKLHSFDHTLKLDLFPSFHEVFYSPVMAVIKSLMLVKL